MTIEDTRVTRAELATIGAVGQLAREAHAAVAIGYRDLLKFLRDPVRIVSTFVFPVIFVLILGNFFEGGDWPFDFTTYVFLGVLGQTVFQSAAMGIISLIEDRENDFSQEIFVAPVSRYTIILGKIGGEASVALAQGLVILIFGVVIGVGMSATQIANLVPATLIIAVFGGAFGLIIMANIGSQRAANQVFPFIMLPQFFLAGVFTPLESAMIDRWLDIASRLAPMRYAVDLVRVAYWGPPGEAPDMAVQADWTYNLGLIAVLFVIFVAIGTVIFVRNEQNR